jgi:hypothetical protein
VQLIVERVRGKGGHAGRVFLWVADEDPYSGLPLRTPLLDVESWDAWRPVPLVSSGRRDTSIEQQFQQFIEFLGPGLEPKRPSRTVIQSSG